MANIKINCKSTTFVDKRNPINNYSNMNTITTGILSNHLSGLHLFKSILNFDVPKIDYKTIISAYLFIFIKNIKYMTQAQSSICICGNHSKIVPSNLSWDSFPADDYTDMFHLNIPKNSANSYVKINVTEILKKLCQNDESYNLILCPIGIKSQMIVTFASSTTENNPYLIIEYEDKLPATYENESIEKANTYDEDVNSDFSSEPPHSHSNFEEKTSDKLEIDKNDTRLYKSKDVSEKNISENNIVESRRKSVLQSKENNSADKDNINILLDTIINNLNTQSQSISELQSSVQDSKSQDILSDIHNKISMQNDEFINIKNIITNSTISKDIVSITSILNSINTNITNQDSKIEIITKDFSTLATTDNLQLINETIADFTKNLDIQKSSLTALIASLKNTCSADDLKSATDRIESLSSTINSLFTKVDLLDDTVKSIDSSSCVQKNISKITSDDIKLINNSINDFAKNLDVQKLSITSLANSLENICSANDLKSTTESIKSLDNAINSLLEKVNSLDNTIKSVESSSVTQDNISNINDLLLEINSVLSGAIEHINSTKEKIIDISSNNTDLISKNSESLLETKNVLAHSITSIDNRLNSLIAENNDSYKSILNSLDELKLKSNLLDDITQTSDVLNKKANSLDYVIEKVDTLSNKLDSIDNLHDKMNVIEKKLQYLDDITKRIDALDVITEKIYNFGYNFNSNLDAALTTMFEAFIENTLKNFMSTTKSHLSDIDNNISELSNKLNNLKDFPFTINERIDKLNNDVISIKTGLDSIGSNIKASPDNSLDLNNIDKRLNELTNSINTISKTLSAISIEPLN